MQCDRYPVGKRKSLKEAEAIADAARGSALQIQLERAAKGAARALDLEELHNLRRRKALARCQARKVREKAQARSAAAKVQRRIAKKQEEAWKERQRWWRRA